MKKLSLTLFTSFILSITYAQPVELYDLVKALVTDSTGYENIGTWAVGKPKQYPVVWKADKIEMSPDTSVNFYRMGNANISIKRKTFMLANKPVSWNVMLKGPRMGYASFSILSSPSKELAVKPTIDSLFGKQPFKAKLLKRCDGKDAVGFYFYEVKLPKKDITFIKISWLSINGNVAIRIDGYDSYSRYSAKLVCN